MSSKINVFEIIKQNYSTFKDEAGKTNLMDWLLMIGLPLLIAALVYHFKIELNSSAYTNIVTAGSIFTGLLLNVLVLVYDQKTKLLSLDIKGDDTGYINYATRKRVIDEVHYNISYCILISLLAVIIGTIGSLDITLQFPIPKTPLIFCVKTWFVDFPLVFVCVHLVLIVLMILKRVHKLIASH